MMLHAEKIDDKGETKAHRKMGRKMVLKQMGRFLGNSLTVGVPFGLALSGFDAAWEEQQAIQRERKKKNPGADLFSDPLQRLQSSVTVPSSNVHL